MTNWKAGAQTAGRWHPKLMLLQGPEGALAAIGSGNLTLGGWQYNSELSPGILPPIMPSRSSTTVYW
jgi:hypothetical protein